MVQNNNSSSTEEKHKQFLNECLTTFDNKLKSWNIGIINREIRETKNLEEIAERLKDISTIGKKVIVDIGDGGSFNEFCNSYEYKNKLIITWYENERKFMESKGHHLVLIPDYMLTLRNPKNNRANLIYISNKKMKENSEWARGDAIGRSKEEAVYFLQNPREGVLIHSNGSYFGSPVIANKLLKFLSSYDSEGAQKNLMKIFEQIDSKSSK